MPAVSLRRQSKLILDIILVKPIGEIIFQIDLVSFVGMSLHVGRGTVNLGSRFTTNTSRVFDRGYRRIQWPLRDLQ